MTERDVIGIGVDVHSAVFYINDRECLILIVYIYFLLKSWETQNFITIKTSWNTND
jgi:hypothetical protein